MPRQVTVAGSNRYCQARLRAAKYNEDFASRATAVNHLPGVTEDNAIENYVKFGIEDIPPEHEGYFNGFLDWFKEHKVVPYGTEVKLYHKSLLYAGTADMLAQVDGVDMLIDFKTSASVQSMLCGVQLEAYSRAYCSHAGVSREQRFLRGAMKSQRKGFTILPRPLKQPWTT